MITRAQTHFKQGQNISQTSSNLKKYEQVIIIPQTQDVFISFDKRTAQHHMINTEALKQCQRGLLAQIMTTISFGQQDDYYSCLNSQQNEQNHRKSSFYLRRLIEVLENRIREDRIGQKYPSKDASIIAFYMNRQKRLKQMAQNQSNLRTGYQGIDQNSLFSKKSTKTKLSYDSTLFKDAIQVQSYPPTANFQVDCAQVYPTALASSQPIKEQLQKGNRSHKVIDLSDQTFYNSEYEEINFSIDRETLHQEKIVLEDQNQLYMIKEKYNPVKSGEELQTGRNGLPLLLPLPQLLPQQLPELNDLQKNSVEVQVMMPENTLEISNLRSQHNRVNLPNASLDNSALSFSIPRQSLSNYFRIPQIQDGVLIKVFNNSSLFSLSNEEMVKICQQVFDETLDEQKDQIIQSDDQSQYQKISHQLKTQDPSQDQKYDNSVDDLQVEDTNSQYSQQQQNKQLLREIMDLLEIYKPEYIVKRFVLLEKRIHISQSEEKLNRQQTDKDFLVQATQTNGRGFGIQRLQTKDKQLLFILSIFQSMRELQQQANKSQKQRSDSGKFQPPNQDQTEYESEEFNQQHYDSYYLTNLLMTNFKSEHGTEKTEYRNDWNSYSNDEIDQILTDQIELNE